MCGVTGDMESAGEGIFECDVGSWGGSVGVGYESTAGLRKIFSEGTVKIVDGGDGGILGLEDGMSVGILLVLGFGHTNRPEGADRVKRIGWGPKPLIA
jgi:hypothetical protein